VIRLVDMENQIRKEIGELLKKHKEIRDVIAQVDDLQTRAVLRMRFLIRKPIDEIASEMQITKRTVIRRLEMGYHDVSLITGYPEPPKKKMPARDRHADSRRMLREFAKQNINVTS
jgi:predicted transcriptional regulator